MLYLLHNLTIKRMQFNTLSYVSENGPGVLTVSGQVQNYNALAQQHDIFSKSEFFKNLEFSSFNLVDNGALLVTTVDDLE